MPSTGEYSPSSQQASGRAGQCAPYALGQSLVLLLRALAMLRHNGPSACLTVMLSLLYVSSVATARAGARSYVAPLCLATAVCCILPHSLCALRWARLPPAMRSAMCEFQVQGVQYGAQSIAVLPDTVRCRRDHLPHCIVVGLQCTALRRLVASGRESSSDLDCAALRRDQTAH